MEEEEEEEEEIKIARFQSNKYNLIVSTTLSKIKLVEVKIKFK